MTKEDKAYRTYFLRKYLLLIHEIGKLDKELLDTINIEDKHIFEEEVPVGEKEIKLFAKRKKQLLELQKNG
jgi:hypothetical protein